LIDDDDDIMMIWFPQQEEVRPEKNVTFNEAVFFDPQEFDEPEEDIIVTMEVPFLSTTPPGGFISEDIEESWVIGDTIEVLPPPSSSESQKALPAPPAPGLPTPRATPGTSEPAGPLETPPVGPSREIRGNVEESNIVVGSRARKPTAKVSQSYAAAFHQAFSVGISHQDPNRHRDKLPLLPRFWHELLRHPHREGFIKAAQTEFQALGRKETFQIVDKGGVTGVLPLTWIFDYKFDHNGYLARYLARICVRGDLQPMSEQETYAATVKMKIFRFILALTAAFDLDTWHADITNAFLNSLLDEEIYCKLPDGFTQPGKCIKLLRALYGLRRAPLL
jgi:hypothetical protein